MESLSDNDARPGHLRRLGVVFQDRPLYFITTCLKDRKKGFLASEANKAVLVSEWESGLAHYGWAVGSYVIMPDHVHFFCRSSGDGATLSGFVGKWKERTSKKLGRLGHPPPVWQREFFDHAIRSNESYSDKWLYVSDNPVRAGLVTQPEEWPYRGRVHFE